MSSEKRLYWDEESNKIVYCHNLEQEPLGHLKYERVGAYMHWCWYQYTDIRMSPGCLQEVRDKQKELIKVRKVPKRGSH